MANVKAVIFDFDDTLVESKIHYVEHHRKVAKLMGLRQPSDEDFKPLWGGSWSAMIEKLWPEADVEHVKNSVMANGKPAIALYTGAGETIDFLRKRGVQVCLLTSRSMDILNQDMRPLGIMNKFFAIEALGDNSVNKPHPEVFSTILKQLEMKGVKKDEILFVGDALVDLQAAQNAKVPFAAVTQGFLTSEDFVKQGLKRNMVFNSIADIKSLFN